jgi:glucarate dehydratase
MLGYVFFVGERTKTDLPYASEPDAEDEWLRVLRGEDEVAAVTASTRAFLRLASPSTRTERGSSKDAKRLMRNARHVLAYAEDPCGAEEGLSGHSRSKVASSRCRLNPGSELSST